MRRRSHMRRAIAPALFTALALAFTACGSDSSSDSSSSTPAASGRGGDIVAKAKRVVETAYRGTNEMPPTSGPRPQAGKRIFVVSCGQSQESCSGPVDAAKEAATLVGWKATVFDGKFNPDLYSQGIRQAVAAKADGILLQAIDCALVKQALAEAKKAKVLVVGLQSADCADLDGQAPRLFSSPIRYGTGISNYAAYVKAWAATKADWIIAHSNGKAKVLNFSENDLPTAALIDAGFRAEIAKCTGCSVTNVKFTAADLGTKLPQLAQQAINTHPDAAYIHAPYDSAVIAGIGPAVTASGRAGKLEVIGGEGFPPNIDMIRAGEQQTAANAFDEAWTGWAGVDTLNRLFHGERAVEQGIGWQLVDREHNLPASGPYPHPVDWMAAYKKAWGKG